MEPITMDEIMSIWEDMNEKSWPGLRTALENRRNLAEGNVNQATDQMVQMAIEKEDAAEPFPADPEELYSLINKE